jgi:Bacterial Ig domain/FG-GAP-like repeat/Putative Ig domain/FG-GAP repeat
MLQDVQPRIVAGTGEGGGIVRVLTTEGALITALPFGPSFAGGVRVATGDINGDGATDLVVGAGPGAGLVRAFSGVDGAPLLSVAPFGGGFIGGVYVAAGDVNGDGRDDVIVGAGSGGLARVFSGDGVQLAAAYPFGPAYTGGVTVAVGDVNGDGRLDVITGTAFGGFVRVFNGLDYSPLVSGFPYGPLFTGGVSVAAGDFDGDDHADVVTGPLVGSAPVYVFSIAHSRLLADVAPFAGVTGMTVAAGDFDNDGRTDLILGAGPGGAPHVRVYSGADRSVLLDAYAFDASFRGGVFVAAMARAGVRFTSPATATFRVGTAGTFDIRTVPGAGVTMSVDGTLPTGVTFTDLGNGTARLTGTPAAGTAGTHALQFRATRDGTVAATQDVTLTIQDAPAFTSAASTTFTEQQAGTFAVTTTGFPNATLSVGGALPTGVTFADQGDGTARLSGTPAAASGGTYPITITATNTAGTATQAFTLTVAGATPVFTSAATTTFVVGTAGSFTVTTAASPAVTSVTVTGALPTGIVLTNNGDGTATLGGTPGPGTAGTHTLTFTATNGVGSSNQTFTLVVHQAPTITSANTATFNIGGAGTFTVTTTGLPVPSLTQTGALPASVTFVDNGNGTATLAGTPTAAGTFPITITATNGVGSAATQTFTLTVQTGALFTSAAGTTFVVGAAGSFAVTTSGTPPVTSLTHTGGTLPAGVTFTPGGATATLAGTPSAGTGGTYLLVFTASNGVGAPVTQNFTLTINEAPSFTSAASTTFAVGVAGSFTIDTAGFPTASITIGGDPLPAVLTFTDNGDGSATLSGTAQPGTSGTYTLTFTASNGIGAAVTQTFTLTIGGLAFTSANTTTFIVGQAGSFTITTAGTPPVTTITRSAEPLPPGVTFTDNLDGTATLAGPPSAGTGGSYSFTLTASNGSGTATQSFILIVHEAPAITSANTVTFTVGTAGSFIVGTTGFPIATITRSGATLPTGVTFVDNGNGTGTLSGTAAATTGGSYAITFTASNGVGSAAAQAFTLNVNEAPTITSASAATFPVGTASSFTVTTTGFPTGAAMTITQGGDPLPMGVTFTNNGNGTATLAGTPAAGSGGVRTLTITAANGMLPNATQTFTLTVSQGPTITSANAVTFTAGTAGSFTVTTTGTPAPTISITGTLPGGVTFTNNGNGTGTLSGTPAAGTGGTYAVTFTATNGAGTDATQAFTLTVNEAPAITSANGATFPVGTASSFTVTTTGFPTGAAMTITQGGDPLPMGVTFTNNGNGTATLAGTPAAGTGGVRTLTITAANGILPNAVQTFTLTVQAPPAFTSLASDTFVVGTADTFTVTASGFPAPTITHTSGTLPTGITFTAPTLGGTATQTGTFPIQFTAANGVNPNAVQGYTLNVVCPTITVTPLSLSNGLYNTAYGPVDFNQTGSTGSTFTWTATGLLSGMTIDATTGVVSGTPTNTVLNGAVTITVTDNFGCQGSVATTLTVRPTTDNENYINGVGNTQFVVGAAVPTTPHVFANDNVKTGDNGPGTLTVTFPATSPNGVITEGAVDGTFIYTPNVGFAGPTDTFTYTLTDGNGVTNTGTVTINLSGLVWYVNSAGGNGDGRSHNPFNSLANAGTASASNSVIYVHTGGATTPGNLTMDANQTLHGQGATFTLNGLTILGGTRPTLTGTVTLANNTIVTAVNLAGPTGFSATLVTGPIAIDQVTVTGGANALSLINVTGAVTVTNTTITNSTGADVLINQGTGTVSIAATISSNAGRIIDIQNRTGGTVSFTGPITDTGQGIFLNANTGSTINFTGGLSLTTGANPGFTATGGGTVAITGSSNTLATTTGTALNVSGTAIGAGGLNFVSINSTGSSGNVGINLSSTGTAGGLNVTGNGIAGTTAGEGTGGTISNKSGDAIVLNNTTQVRLNDMIIGVNAATAGEGQPNTTNNIGGDAIKITSVTPAASFNYGLTLDNVTISQTGGDGIDGQGGGNAGLKIDVSRFLNVGDDLATTTESAINFGTGFPSTDQITGTVHIRNSTFAGFTGYGFTTENSGNGTLNMTVEDSTFKNNDGTTVGNSGIQLIVDGSTTANNPKLVMLVEDTTFTNLDLDGVEVTTDPGATSNVTIRRTTYSNPNGDNAIHMVSGSIDADDVESMTVWIEDTTITSQRGTLIFLKSGAGTYNATVTNTAGFAGKLDSGINVDGGSAHIGRGIEVLFDADNADAITAKVLIENQTLRNIGVDGIHVATNETNTTAGANTFDITIRNNIIGEVGAETGRQGTGEGIEIRAGGTGNASSAGTMNLLADGNTIRMRDPGAANPGMEGIDLDAEADFTLNATVTANNFNNPANTGENVSADSETATSELHLDIRNNTSSAGNDPDYTLTQTAGTFRVEGPGTGAVTAANIQTAQTSGTASVTGTVLFNNNVNVTMPATPPTATLPPVPPATLLAGVGGVEAAQSHDVPVLTQAELDVVSAAAVVRWIASGLTTQQMAAVRSVTFEVADLPVGYLAEIAGERIRIDRDAASRGWFLDRTPLDDVEFADRSGNQRAADPSGAPAGRYDLLTAVMHEIGHGLRRDDLDPVQHEAQVMAATLPVGVRRLWTADNGRD